MSPRKLFRDSAETLPKPPSHTRKGLTIQTAQASDLRMPMGVLFALEAHEEAEERLEKLVSQGRVVSVDELAREHGVEAAESQTLVKWLVKQKFEVLRVSKDNSSVFARAPASQIERSLDVKMVRVTSAGVTCIAARSAPSLPEDIATSVHAIIGLQPYRRASKHAIRLDARNADPSPVVHAPGTVDPESPPYMVSQIAKAYDADGLDVKGKGQTIAILIDTVPLDSDLTAFWTANGVPGDLSRIERVNVSDGDLPPPEGEETLDASWASALAPDACVRVYAAGSLHFPALDAALDRILEDVRTHPEMRQLAISIGLGETYMQPAELRTQHAKFLRLAALGVNVFVSAGDAGAHPDESGHRTTGPLQVEYAASDPCVVAVGGTSLALSRGGVVFEAGWATGGGGISQVQTFRRPAWQTGQGVIPGKTRLVPDVSIAADPLGGCYLVLHGSIRTYGGTSWGAPMWAAICALVNEARANAKLPPLGYLNPRLYPLLGTDALRDIVTGSNGEYSAGRGYDMVTGLGVPNVRKLIAALTMPEAIEPLVAAAGPAPTAATLKRAALRRS